MKSNKNKNNKNKYFGSFTVLLLVVLVTGWLTATAYIGKQTEEQVRSALIYSASSESKTTSVGFELIEYKRYFFRAAFKVRLHANDKELDDALNGLVFHTDVKHGPLVFNDTNLQPATVSFHSYLDNSMISAEMRDVVIRLFSDVKPINANLLVDYDLNKHYQLDLSAFEYETTDIIVSVSDSSMKGVIESDTKDTPVKLEIGEIAFNQGNESLEFFRNALVLNLFSDTQNQLTASILMTDNAKYTGMTVNLDNLRLKPLLELMVRYEDRYSNEQQIGWTLEAATQYQEGQDRLISLFTAKEDLVLPEAGLLVSQLLKQGMKDISFIKKISETELAYNK